MKERGRGREVGGCYEMESNMEPISPGDQGPGWKLESA
jgi:hypothetical protein